MTCQVKFFWDDGKAPKSVGLAVVPALDAGSAITRLRDQEQVHPLTCVDRTLFETVVELPYGLHYYLFLIDGDTWRYEV